MDSYAIRVWPPGHKLLMPGRHYMSVAALEPRSGPLQTPSLHPGAIASTLHPHNPPQIGLTYSEIADKAPRKQVISCHGTLVTVLET